ncbi:MAG: serpin family protein, partial [Anaerolineae bacterium]
MTMTHCFNSLLAVLSIFSALFGHTAEPLPKEDTLKMLVKDETEFALSLSKKSEIQVTANWVVSPYSIFSCLSLLYGGARGQTAQEIKQALYLSFSQNTLPLASRMLFKSLSSSKNDALSFQLDTANALWLDRDTFVLTDFRRQAEDYFDAKVESVDFRETEKTTSIINEWIENQTQKKIIKMLEETDIDAS